MKNEDIFPVSWLRQSYSYCPATGVIRRLKEYNGHMPGRVFGTLTHQGYLCGTLHLNGARQWMNIHRIAWAIFYGEWPIGIIDHVDGDGSNNKIENLRIATHQQNQWNRKSRKGSSSLYKGVTWHKKSAKWQAQIKIGGKSQYLGLFENETDAAEAYKSLAVEAFGEFARLT